MADEPVYLFLAVYDTEEAAREDFQDVKQLHRDHELGTYDAAVVAKQRARLGARGEVREAHAARGVDRHRRRRGAGHPLPAVGAAHGRRRRRGRRD